MDTPNYENDVTFKVILDFEFCQHELRHALFCLEKFRLNWAVSEVNPEDDESEAEYEARKTWNLDMIEATTKALIQPGKGKHITMEEHGSLASALIDFMRQVEEEDEYCDEDTMDMLNGILHKIFDTSVLTNNGTTH